MVRYIMMFPSEKVWPKPSRRRFPYVLEAPPPMYVAVCLVDPHHSFGLRSYPDRRWSTRARSKHFSVNFVNGNSGFPVLMLLYTSTYIPMCPLPINGGSFSCLLEYVHVQYMYVIWGRYSKKKKSLDIIK